jgi:hypothetical protein
MTMTLSPRAGQLMWRPCITDTLAPVPAQRTERSGYIAFVLIDAAATAEIPDGAFGLEAVAPRFVDRIARDPKLIASHACITAAAIDVAAHRAFLLHDLGDARAFGRGQCDSVFIVDVAAPIAEIFDGPLSFEAIAVILVMLVALDPELLTRLGIRWEGGQACGNCDHCRNHRQQTHRDPPLDYRAAPERHLTQLVNCLHRPPALEQGQLWVDAVEKVSAKELWN